jgi:hypothetical protein
MKLYCSPTEIHHLIVNTPVSPVLGRQHQTTRRGGGGISPLPRQAVSVHNPRKGLGTKSIGNPK